MAEDNDKPTIQGTGFGSNTTKAWEKVMGTDKDSACSKSSNRDSSFDPADIGRIKPEGVFANNKLYESMEKPTGKPKQIYVYDRARTPTEEPVDLVFFKGDFNHPHSIARNVYGIPLAKIKAGNAQFSELELEVIRMALTEFGQHGKYYFTGSANVGPDGHLHPLAASMSLVYGVVKSLQEKLGRSIYAHVDRTSIEKAVANNVGVDTTATVEKASREQAESYQE